MRQELVYKGHTITYERVNGKDVFTSTLTGKPKYRSWHGILKSMEVVLAKRVHVPM